MRRAITILPLLIGLVAALAAIPFSASASESAAHGWTGWDALDTVVNTADMSDPFVAEASSELDLYLEQISGRSWTSTTTDPGGPAIRLVVDPSDPALAGRNDEAVRIVSDANGITITGATNVAIREGAAILLEKTGVRWFFKQEDWTVVPTSFTDFGAIDEVHEPAFIHREIWHSHGINSGGWGNPGDYMTWKRRNRLDGAVQFRIGHNYRGIVPLNDPNAPPEVYCPSATPPTSEWQLRPDHPYVVSAAIAKARDKFENPYYESAEVEFPLLRFSANVSPRDGGIGGWCPDYAGDHQVISDKVVGLANAVATALEADFPDRPITVYSYADHDLVSTVGLHRNVVPVVAEFGTSTLSGTRYRDRVADYAALNPGLLGVRDYYDVSQWSKDRPPGVGWGADTYTLLRDIPFYADNGVDVLVMEAADGWGSRGLLYYAASKLYWDPYADLDALFQDFYDKSFGPASAPMKRYFERILAAVPPTDRFFALSFRDLDEAEALAAGDTPVLNRIRQTQYYVRYYWLRTQRNRGDLGTDLLKDIYDIVYRTRALYILHHKVLSDDLELSLAAAGVTTAEIAALENTTPPSNAEARIWMDEALAYYATATPVHAPLIDVFDLDLIVAGNATLPTLNRIGTLFARETLVRTSGAETVQVDGLTSGELTWNNPVGQPLQSAATGSGPINFNSTEAGNYYLTTTGWVTVNSNQPVGMLVSTIKPITKTASVAPSGRINGSELNSAYFDVPEGTPALIVGLRRVSAQVVPTIELFAPTGAGGSLEVALAEQTCTVPIVGQSLGYVNICEYPIVNPAPGIWRIDYLFGSAGQDLYLLGVPPLMWHNPQTLAITTGGATWAVPTPPIPVDDTYSLNEDGVLVVSAELGFLTNDPVGAVILNVSSSPNGSVTSYLDGSFTYTPSGDFFGIDTFTYITVNGTGASDPATVTINVEPINDPPAFATGPDQAVNPNTGPVSLPGWAAPVVAGPGNESGQSVWFVLSNDNAALFTTPPTVSPTGTLTYEPSPAASGIASVTISIQDDGGTATGGVDSGPVYTFEIAVGTIIRGSMALQGVLVDTGGWATIAATVTLTASADGAVTTTVLKSDGTFEIPVFTTGDYSIRLSAGGFMPANRALITIGDIDIDMPHADLIAGMVDSDSFIGGTDISLLINTYGSLTSDRTDGFGNWVDLNADGAVSGLDISALLANIGKSGTQPW